MEHQERNSNPFKIIVFILIGGALVILTDLFILDKKHTVFNSFISSDLGEDLVISNLKIQHKSYMDEGIEIEPEILSLAHAMPPPIMDENIEIVDIRAPIMDVQATETVLAKIAPAVGVERNTQDIERYFKQKPLVEMAHYEEEKSVSDIISALHIPEETEMEAASVTLNDVISAVENVDTPSENLVKHHYNEPQGSGMVVIIIDDMGITLRSKQVEVLSGPLTLSYLPYAKNLSERTKRASANGHELMLHMPMEPMNGSLDGGPRVLTTKQGEVAFIETLQWGLDSFNGFVGVNNHMGSRLTKDALSMHRVMDHLKDKDLYFIDSKTIGSSVAARIARDTGIPYAERDVFLDHEINTAFIKDALKQLERTARDQGYAIAIGHPHKETIAALKEWLPTLEEKGLTLVPASRVIKVPSPVPVGEVHSRLYQ
ncbi:MAG: hypothetical protein COB14_03970 [Alphaproteobacteria bacterium]|nr:MAG: hypothetical protein COB14_03970 [Alphaproteobacteria bacterium]